MKDTLHTCFHYAHQDLIDTFSDREILDMWFTQAPCSTEDSDKFKEVTAGLMTRVHDLGEYVVDSLPDNRIEKIQALMYLQSVVMWSCACLKRSHAVNNILQKRRWKREINAMEALKKRDIEDQE